jgi:hypothetical protein
VTVGPDATRAVRPAEAIRAMTHDLPSGGFVMVTSLPERVLS